MSSVLTYIASNGDIHMLSDSCWTNGNTGTYEIAPVLKTSIANIPLLNNVGDIEGVEKIGIGYTGSVSVMQYLSKQFEWPEKTYEESNFEYILKLASIMRTDHIFSMIMSNDKTQFEISIAMEDKIYLIDCDLCVWEQQNRWLLTGFQSETFCIIFEYLKLSSIEINDDNFKSIFERIITAISNRSEMVKPPFNWNVIKKIKK